MKSMTPSFSAKIWQEAERLAGEAKPRIIEFLLADAGEHGLNVGMALLETLEFTPLIVAIGDTVEVRAEADVSEASHVHISGNFDNFRGWLWQAIERFGSISTLDSAIHDKVDSTYLLVEEIPDMQAGLRAHLAELKGPDSLDSLMEELNELSPRLVAYLENQTWPDAAGALGDLRCLNLAMSNLRTAITDFLSADTAD